MFSGELVLDNEECLEVISKQLHLLTLKHAKQILDYLRVNIGHDLDLKDTVVDIVLRIMCQQRDLKILDEFLQDKEPHRIIAEFDLEIDQYFNQLLEYLNKVTLISLDLSVKSLSPVLRAITIDPRRTVSEIIRFCLNDSSQTESGLVILKSVKGFSSDFIEEAIRDRFKPDLESIPAEMELFLWKVFESQFIDSFHFVRNVIFAVLTELVQREGPEEQVLVLLNVLKRVFLPSFKLNPDLAVPILVGIGFIADKYRWDLMNYSDLKTKIVQCSVVVIKSLTDQTKDSVSVKRN